MLRSVFLGALVCVCSLSAVFAGGKSAQLVCLRDIFPLTIDSDVTLQLTKRAKAPEISRSVREREMEGIGYTQMLCQQSIASLNKIRRDLPTSKAVDAAKLQAKIHRIVHECNLIIDGYFTTPRTVASRQQEAMKIFYETIAPCLENIISLETRKAHDHYLVLLGHSMVNTIKVREELSSSCAKFQFADQLENNRFMSREEQLAIDYQLNPSDVEDLRTSTDNSLILQTALTCQEVVNRVSGSPKDRAWWFERFSYFTLIQIFSHACTHVFTMWKDAERPSENFQKSLSMFWSEGGDVNCMCALLRATSESGSASAVGVCDRTTWGLDRRELKSAVSSYEERVKSRSERQPLPDLPLLPTQGRGVFAPPFKPRIHMDEGPLKRRPVHASPGVVRMHSVDEEPSAFPVEERSQGQGQGLLMRGWNRVEDPRKRIEGEERVRRHDGAHMLSPRRLVPIPRDIRPRDPPLERPRGDVDVPGEGEDEAEEAEDERPVRRAVTEPRGERRVVNPFKRVQEEEQAREPFVVAKHAFRPKPQGNGYLRPLTAPLGVLPPDVTRREERSDMLSGGWKQVTGRPVDAAAVPVFGNPLVVGRHKSERGKDLSKKSVVPPIRRAPGPVAPPVLEDAQYRHDALHRAAQRDESLYHTLAERNNVSPCTFKPSEHGLPFGPLAIPMQNYYTTNYGFHEGNLIQHSVWTARAVEDLFVRQLPYVRYFEQELKMKPADLQDLKKFLIAIAFIHDIGKGGNPRRQRVFDLVYHHSEYAYEMLTGSQVPDCFESEDDIHELHPADERPEDIALFEITTEERAAIMETYPGFPSLREAGGIHFIDINGYLKWTLEVIGIPTKKIDKFVRIAAILIAAHTTYGQVLQKTKSVDWWLSNLDCLAEAQGYDGGVDLKLIHLAVVLNAADVHGSNQVTLARHSMCESLRLPSVCGPPARDADQEAFSGKYAKWHSRSAGAFTQDMRSALERFVAAKTDASD